MFFEKVKEITGHRIEAWFFFIIIVMTWLGFGNEMAGLLVIASVGFLIFKRNRHLFVEDKTLLVLALFFTVNCVISSLLSIDKLESSLLSLVWLLVILLPVSFTRFSLEDDQNFLVKWIIPASIVIAMVIVFYLMIFFWTAVIEEGLKFKRYSFYYLGTTTTSDVLIMLGGIGYGWWRQKQKERYRWFGFLYILLCAFGVFTTLDRGGIIALFVVIVILLAYDYKRLILFFFMIALLVFLSYKIRELRIFRYTFDFFINRNRLEILRNGQQLDTFRTAWLMIKDHWLMGVGTNNFSTFSKQYGSGKWYAYAHNFILQFWAENGLFGLLLGLSIIGLVLYRWVRVLKLHSRKYVMLGIGVSYIGMLIGNLSNSSIWKIKIALPFWIIAGIITTAYFECKKRKYREQR